MTKISTERNYGIDLIKIIACLGVLGLHVFADANFHGENDWINQVLYYAGTPAIPLFFMANGYFVLNKVSISFRYSLKKIMKLMFVVLAWGLMLFFAETLVKNNGNFVYNVFGGLVQTGHLYHFWFLGSLMILYAIAPILLFLINRYKHFLVFAIIFFTAICFIIDFYSHLNGFPVQSQIIQTFRLWTWINYYMIGCAIKRVDFGKFNQKSTLMLLALISFIVLLLYSFFNKEWIHDKFAEFNYDNPFTFFFCIAFFILLAVYFKGSSKCNHVIELISSVTMGIYIIHPFVIALLEKVTGIYSGSQLSLLFVLVVIFATFIVNIMIRVPIVKYIIQT